MAALISKVVRSGATTSGDGFLASSSHKSHPAPAGSQVVITGGHSTQRSAKTFQRMSKVVDVEARGGSSSSQVPLAEAPNQHILKTVETMVLVDNGSGRLGGKL